MKEIATNVLLARLFATDDDSPACTMGLPRYLKTFGLPADSLQVNTQVELLPSQICEWIARPYILLRSYCAATSSKLGLALPVPLTKTAGSAPPAITLFML